MAQFNASQYWCDGWSHKGKVQSVKVNFWYWLRAFLMCCIFVVSVIAIRRLDRFSASMCPTRVKGIAFQDTQIVQDQMTWYRKRNGMMEELDPLAVERWLGRNCRLKLESSASENDPSIEFQFVDGRNQVFKASALKQAVTELSALPLKLRPSR